MVSMKKKILNIDDGVRVNNLSLFLHVIEKSTVCFEIYVVKNESGNNGCWLEQDKEIDVGKRLRYTQSMTYTLCFNMQTRMCSFQVLDL